MSLFSAFLPAPLILAIPLFLLGFTKVAMTVLFFPTRWELMMYSPNGRCDDNAGEGTRGEIKAHEPRTDGMFVDRAAHRVIEREKQEWRWSRACALWYTRIRGLKVYRLQSQLHYSITRRQESPT
ncbi:hypothetical protein BU17DRAFT_67820 [Hysterangium stoloniferum]|nr:hypothetical protein BU17DRAFT_67820 [Hysterangium stoloniferum]